MVALSIRLHSGRVAAQPREECGSAREGRAFPQCKRQSRKKVVGERRRRREKNVVGPEKAEPFRGASGRAAGGTGIEAMEHADLSTSEPSRRVGGQSRKRVKNIITRRRTK